MFSESESRTLRHQLPSTGVEPRHPRLLAWLDEVVSLCRPSAIHYLDGSAQEASALAEQLVEAGTLLRLNDELQPNSFYARTEYLAG